MTVRELMAMLANQIAHGANPEAVVHAADVYGESGSSGSFEITVCVYDDAICELTNEED